jgi:signal transduction histidine kinase
LYFTTKPKGSGIGLAMTYRIVQLHGGEMEVRSNAEVGAAERGTTFMLSVPLAVGPVLIAAVSEGRGAINIETNSGIAKGMD